MKIKLNIFAALFVTTLISGCLTTYSPDSYDSKVFSSGKKGIAVLQVTQYSPQVFEKTNFSLTYHLKKLGDDKKYIIYSRNSFFPGISNEHDYTSSVMMLDPGIYYIDFIRLVNQGSLTRWYPSPGIKLLSSKGGTKKYIIQMGAFEVKPGKVSYFGYLNLESSGKLPFKITNEIEKARTDINKNEQGEISNRLEFQPFYQAGSVLIETNGKMSIIKREEIDHKLKEVMNKANQHFDELTNPK